MCTILLMIAFFLIFTILCAAACVTIGIILRSRIVKANSKKYNLQKFKETWERLYYNSGVSIQQREKSRRSKHPGKNRHRYSIREQLAGMMLRSLKTRREYYREVYLKSEAWQRKRFIVLKRDKWCCVHCGKPATQVHHKQYARKIGKEPIEWLESICKSCHENIHR